MVLIHHVVNLTRLVYVRIVVIEVREYFPETEPIKLKLKQNS